MLRLAGALCGSVAAQPSKSLSHRAIIAAALSPGTSVISNVALSEDVAATVRCVEALGAGVSLLGAQLKVCGIAQKRELALLNCGESGSTYRFLYPVAPLVAKRASFLTGPSLSGRPMEPLKALLVQKGAAVDGNSISGKYAGGLFELPGNVSSQFISGLLFALPLLSSPCRIVPSPPLQSAPYVELTRACLAGFGVTSAWQNGGIDVLPSAYRPANYTVEGDWSHAAFFFAAGALYQSVTVSGLAANSLQGDRQMLDILKRMGARVAVSGGAVTVAAGPLTAVDIDAANLPDIVPTIAALACFAKGKTRIYNAARLRFKESNRLAALCAELSRLGADVEETGDGLIINGGRQLSFAECRTHNDHRIAMALALIAGRCRGGLAIDAPGCTSKSAPRFFEEYTALGGKANE